MNIKRFVVGALATNSYLLTSKQDLAILDPGAEAEFLTAQIERIPAELKYIILTHFHFDHTLGVIFLKEKFPSAKILIHQKEKEYIEHYCDGVGIKLGKPSDNASDLEKDTYINYKVDRFLKNDEAINFGDEELKVIHTPGHSKGSICLLGRGILFSGDTIFSDGIGRTDLAGSSSSDMANSLKRLQKIIKPGTRVYPGHGEMFDYKI